MNAPRVVSWLPIASMLAAGAGGLGWLLLIFAGKRGGVEPWVSSTGAGLASSTLEYFVEQQAAATGRGYFSPRFRDAIRREGGKPMAVGKILSRREQQVLAHVLTGKTSREIGELIGLSARTVEFHRANVMAKLGATNTTEFVANARRLGVGRGVPNKTIAG